MESHDGLPGLIVDRYDDILAASFLSCGTERWKTVIADELLAQTGLTKLYERSDSNVRKLEGLCAARAPPVWCCVSTTGGCRSGGISADLFHKIIASAGIDAPCDGSHQ